VTLPPNPILIYNLPNDESERIMSEVKAINTRYLPADVKTPLGTVGRVPLETLPEPPAQPAAEPAKAARSITLATTVGYRDYEITVTATGFTLDQFCDMLDKRLGVVGE
jgi:hypothetical protein